MKSFRFRFFFLIPFLIFFLSSPQKILAQQDSSILISKSFDWEERESEHFKIIFRTAQAHLIQHILSLAENAFRNLEKVFNYSPADKIIIMTYDIYDYGSGTTTTVPENYLRIDIEPLEHGYEAVPFSDRFQWILSHELVHIFVNDQANKFESIMRTAFGKVAPDQEQPITIPFSLLTNHNRYTPRWHQESMPVFMEAWLTGGYGRILGNFDEMYFRSIVFEKKKIPDQLKVEANLPSRSFLTNIVFYLYGARFTAYLSLKYGIDKLFEWFNTPSDDFYSGTEKRFNNIFGIELDKAWNDFIIFEKDFQNKNMDRLKTAEITPVIKLSDYPIGWSTEAYLDSSMSSVIFGFHHPDDLAGIEKLNIENKSFKEIGTLPTPSILQVASTAYDKNLNLIFFTTNNNELYRDIWYLNTSSQEKKLLFKNYRIGDLSVASSTHDLWGIMHSGGRVSIAVAEYPYIKMNALITFDEGIEINDLSVSPSGKYLAAVLHRNNGDQSIIVGNCEELKKRGLLNYETITSIGTPENPSWSPDEQYIFWNAYANGVSNIYRIEIKNRKVEALTNTISGLFRPLYISKDSLFAFEFTSDGLYPVLISNKPANRLPAIKYLGQQIIEVNPSLKDLAFSPDDKNTDTLIDNKHYSSLGNLQIHTLIPVISGFQSEKVLGLFTHISDPLSIHDLSLELGISPFNKNSLMPKYHLKFKYNYRRMFQLDIDYNAADFYDLFNKRKRGMIGTKLSLQNTYYWLYDNPLKIKQISSISLYKDVKSINDNLVDVSQPDFYVFQSDFNASNLRRSVGSSGNELGNEFGTSLIIFGAGTHNLETASQIYTEWDNYSRWLFPHNVLHVKMAAGYHFKNKNLQQAQFFFGGFGNREVENVEPDQFRNVFRFPGIPIYSLPAERFFKLMFEFNMPPIRFNSFDLGPHYLNYIDISLYNQNLLLESPVGKVFTDAGGQINFSFEHWYNLESTFSAGIAKAWYGSGNHWEWFLSFKLLKNL